MKILMVTNTYTPHVGGVARSVELFTRYLRGRGHDVVVVAPTFKNMPENEKDIIRVPAIENISGSDFSMRLPIPGYLQDKLKDFQPEIVHSHHPFLQGTTAARVACQYNTPLVFTYHTMYEHYMHYFTNIKSNITNFVITLTSGYANLCDAVIAPSKSIAEILKDRDVHTDIYSIPTGIEIDKFSSGSRKKFRAKLGLSDDIDLIGHLGRLAPEKNLIFLAEATAKYMKKNEQAHFMVTGSGESVNDIKKIFKDKKIDDRLHFTGTLKNQDLIDAYYAMDVFVFASKTETQGMVLAEAMACSVPVVAIDANGVREVVQSGKNGIMIKEENVDQFANAVDSILSSPPEKFKEYQENALQTAHKYSMDNCCDKLLEVYQKLKQQNGHKKHDENLWLAAMDRIKVELDIFTNLFTAAEHFITDNK
jgi:1,2-diacylglycerol 3-alpha-glucosyltransferase